MAGCPRRVITASRPEWIEPFTGLSPAQFRTLVRLVAARGGDQIADGRPGSRWALDLPDRVPPVATWWRTNLTMRQRGPLCGIWHSAVHRVLDTLGPLLALGPVRRRRADQVAIVDGTLVPTRDHTLATPSKNHRYSTNPQVAIDADTGLVAAVGDRRPGNLNDTVAYRTCGIDQQLEGGPVVADGGYRGNPALILPYRRRGGGEPLPGWQAPPNTRHRQVRAAIEHAFARMKTYKVLRDHRRAASTLKTTAAGIALLHNLALAG